MLQKQYQCSRLNWRQQRGHQTGCSWATKTNHSNRSDWTVLLHSALYTQAAWILYGNSEMQRKIVCWGFRRLVQETTGNPEHLPSALASSQVLKFTAISSVSEPLSSRLRRRIPIDNAGWVGGWGLAKSSPHWKTDINTECGYGVGNVYLFAPLTNTSSGLRLPPSCRQAKRCTGRLGWQRWQCCVDVSPPPPSEVRPPSCEAQ